MKPQEARQQARRQHVFVLVCLFVTGACALVLEILGARLISPYFGSSLYCWSALITVTLGSLAAGYQWGGRLADKTPALTLAARLLGVAALAVALMPALRVTILRAAAPLGVQLGALVAAAALLSPALVLLSAFGPLAVRLTVDSLADVGRSTGGVYAVSTVGSVAGAALAGFVLIPHLPLSKILYGMAIVLLLLSAWASHVSQRRLPLAQLAMAAAIAALGFWPRDRAETNIVLSRESAYGQIKVLDSGTRRYLLVNGTTQSMAFLPQLRADSQYARVMELGAASKPRAKSALVIGLGAGLMTTTLEREYGLAVDSVEIDPAVVDAARDFFGFAPKGGVFIEDGRGYLERAQRRYDLIYLDAFGAEAPPFHLFTTESFAAMRRRLTPDGLLVVNLVSAVHGEEGKTWRSAYRTLQSAFPSVNAYLASEPVEDLANVVFFAGAADLPKTLPPSARPDIRKHIAQALARPLTPEGAAFLMTDDFAPMESLMAQASVRWRRNLQQKVSDVLLY